VTERHRCQHRESSGVGIHSPIHTFVWADRKFV